MTTLPGLLLKLSSDQDRLRKVQFYCSPGRVLAIVSDELTDTRMLLDEISGYSSQCHTHVAFAHKSWCDEQRELVLPARERSVAWLGEQSSLLSHMSITQHVEFAIEHSHQPIGDGQLHRLLHETELVGLMEQMPHQLSTEQTLRVELLLALVRQVDVMYKPTARLNGLQREQFIKRINQIKPFFNGSMVIVAEDYSDVHLYADELLVMVKGCSVQQGPVHETLEHPCHVSSALLLGYKNIFQAKVASHLDKHNISLFTWGAYTFETHLIRATIGSTIHWLVPNNGIGLISMLHPNAPRANTVAGVIQAYSVIHDTVYLQIAIPMAAENKRSVVPIVQLETPSHTIARQHLQKGAEIRLHFPEQKIHWMFPSEDTANA